MTWKTQKRLQFGSGGLRVFWVLVDGNGDLVVERSFASKDDALAYANSELATKARIVLEEGIEEILNLTDGQFSRKAVERIFCHLFRNDHEGLARIYDLETQKND